MFRITTVMQEAEQETYIHIQSKGHLARRERSSSEDNYDCWNKRGKNSNIETIRTCSQEAGLMASLPCLHPAWSIPRGGCWSERLSLWRASCFSQAARWTYSLGVWSSISSFSTQMKSFPCTVLQLSSCGREELVLYGGHRGKGRGRTYKHAQV